MRWMRLGSESPSPARSESAGPGTTITSQGVTLERSQFCRAQQQPAWPVHYDQLWQCAQACKLCPKEIQTPEWTVTFLKMLSSNRQKRYNILGLENKNTSVLLVGDDTLILRQLNRSWSGLRKRTSSVHFLFFYGATFYIKDICHKYRGRSCPAVGGDVHHEHLFSTKT